MEVTEGSLWVDLASVTAVDLGHDRYSDSWSVTLYFPGGWRAIEYDSKPEADKLVARVVEAKT